MNPIKRVLKSITEILNVVLVRQTGYKPPPAMDFFTRQGYRIPCESKYVMRVLPASALPDEVTACNNNWTVSQMAKNDTYGYNLGDNVVVCFDTAVGFTAVRAKVVLRGE